MRTLTDSVNLIRNKLYSTIEDSVIAQDGREESNEQRMARVVALASKADLAQELLDLLNGK